MGRTIHGPGLVVALALVILSVGCSGDTEETTTPGPSETLPVCTSDCADRECGDDGCGQSCGACLAGNTCNTDGVCVGIDENLLDPDNDGFVNQDDNCDFEPNMDQNDVDGDGLGDACDTDIDNDGITNAACDGDDQPPCDNCPTVPNQWQHDEDDDGIGTECDADLDNDGYLNDLDCAPEEEEINPSIKEACGDGVDNNCDGITDGEGAKGCVNYYVDSDGDGAGDPDTARCLCAPEPPHSQTMSGDCDDDDPIVSSLVDESCDDADNNCNLLVDEGCDDDEDGWCDASMEVVGSPAICPNGGGDCYDYSSLINPGQEEVVNDGIDNNCDGNKAGDEVIISECPESCFGTTNDDPSGPCEVTNPLCACDEPDPDDCSPCVCDASALCALDFCFPENVGAYSVTSPVNSSLDYSWDVVEHYGNPTNDLSPFQGDSLLVLSTGWAHPVPSPTKKKKNGNQSEPDPFALGDAMYDAVRFTVELTVPSDVTGFSLDYLFMSVEYDEHIGYVYNDKFYIILNGPMSTGGQDKVVNFAECSTSALAEDEFQPDYVDPDGNEWCYITVNAALSEPCYCDQDSDCLMNSCQFPVGEVNGQGKCKPAYTDITGTGFECEPGYPTGPSSQIKDGSSTGWLTTTWPVHEAETITLTIHIQDTGDYYLDSTVLVDNFQWIGGLIVAGTASHN